MIEPRVTMAHRAEPAWTHPLVGNARPGGPGAATAHVPHVVAWNLTRRCNLACAHCYIAAGAWHTDDDELSTSECLRILDEILAVSPGVLLVLSGGEPLVRRDLETIAGQAVRGGATVVVGTNGTGLTEPRIESLMDAGVSGVAISIDSLDASYHDRFRHGSGALHDTLRAVDGVRRAGLDFIVQTSLTRGNRGEIGEIAAWAARMGAVSFNLYFLVETGRGEGMRGLPPAENDAVLRDLIALEALYRGTMLVRSKCQPQIMRHAYESGPGSSLLNYATRCPCGVQYCRITPDGRVTPCPYMPAVAGDLREESFRDVWERSSLFRVLRGGRPGGKCGRCEYREVCGGCRARAYAHDGDFLAEDRSCAYEPDGTVPVVRPLSDTLYGVAERAPELPWTLEATERISRVPSFVRGVVARRVEVYARERGEAVVTVELLDRVRRDLPVDFSKRLPFFARSRQ